MTNTSINNTPYVEDLFVNNVYVVIAEYDQTNLDGSEDRDVKVLTSLTSAVAHVHDMKLFDAKRIRAYRVFADPEGGQLHEDTGLNFDAEAVDRAIAGSSDPVESMNP